MTLMKKLKNKAPADKQAKITEVSKELAPPIKPFKEWPNVGKIVWTEPVQWDNYRYQNYDINKLEAPKGWRIEAETVHVIDLVALTLDKGEAVLQTRRISKQRGNHYYNREFDCLYESAETIYARRVEFVEKLLADERRTIKGHYESIKKDRQDVLKWKRWLRIVKTTERNEKKAAAKRAKSRIHEDAFNKTLKQLFHPGNPLLTEDELALRKPKVDAAVKLDRAVRRATKARLKGRGSIQVVGRTNWKASTLKAKKTTDAVLRRTKKKAKKK